MQSQYAQPSNELASAHHARLQSLKSKHEALSKKIERERQHSYAPEGLITRLKKEKLLLKEEIEGLRKAS